jgi:hypothetical protein
MRGLNLNINTMKKSYFIKLTEDEMDLLALMLLQESDRASNRARYATSEMDDYGCKDELKSLWKKVYTNGVSFPYKLTPNYEKS